VQGGITHQSSAPATLRTLIALAGPAEFPPNIVNPRDFLGNIRSSTLVDLFAGLDWPKWSVEMFATNVFDKRNDISRGVNCGSCTRTLIVPGTPRTIGLRAGIKF